ncbi:hypothetical protein [Caballeronia novacaledonica]|uniref:Uncharacterized protein n=1 Tax=Caballeronia novacaledonica TaxID=1544861 RepID=A0AA37IIK6_9BURK|nr:hypothetical protein [Caballeronia novacaledonica]GJH30385.1 hypothetical protein CBA19CS42_37735 [Caballeronia novacaledonica]
MSASAQRDFVAHIVGEDPRHAERVDGEAVYHLAHSPMPEFLRCDVAAPVLPPALECVPAESNLIPSIARARTRNALAKISACLHEPVIGPRSLPGSRGQLLQWFITDWREHWPTRYRVAWSASLSDPAWTLEAAPLVDDGNDAVARATREYKRKDHSAAGHACRQMLAVVAAAQTDFRGTLGRVSEHGQDMSLVESSLRLIDFDVKVGVGGNSPNMLFAERVSPSTMSRENAEQMGTVASRVISSCLQVRAERIADKVYPTGDVEFVWRITDRFASRPVLIFTVVRYQPASGMMSRTAIRVERQDVMLTKPLGDSNAKPKR